MIMTLAIQDTQSMTTSALQQAMKALAPCDGGEQVGHQRGAEKRLMEKQRRLNRFLGKLNDWEEAHKQVAYHGSNNKSRTYKSLSEDNKRRSQDLDSIHPIVPGIPIARVFSWASCECMKQGIPVPKTNVRDEACVRMAASICAKRIQTAWKQHKRKMQTRQILSDDLRRQVVDELPVASHIIKPQESDPEKCKALLTSRSNLRANDSIDGHLSALVASLGPGASQTPPKARKPTRTAKVTVATAPRFHTAERSSRTVASMAARLKMDVNPVSKAEAALIELQRMEGIEIPRKTAYTPKKESSMSLDDGFSREQQEHMPPGQQPGLTWSKTPLNRLICDSGSRDDNSKHFAVQQDGSAAKVSSPSAIPVEAVARERDPPMSTAMMAVLKKRANCSSRQNTPTPVAMKTSSQTSGGQTSGMLQSHRKTADLGANTGQKNLAISRTARNSKSSHPNEIQPDGHRLEPMQTRETCKAMFLTGASNQKTLSSTRGRDTEEAVSGRRADLPQVHEIGNKPGEQGTKACNAAPTPMELNDILPAADIAIRGDKHTQPSQVHGQVADLLVLEDRDLEPVACQSPRQQDMMRKAANAPAHQRPGLLSNPRTLSPSSLASSQQRRASTGNTFPFTQVTIMSSTANSHSTVKTGAATVLPNRQRWSVDSGSAALVQIQAMKASSSNLQTCVSSRTSTGSLWNSTSVSTSSKAMIEGKTSAVASTSTQKMGGMPWTPMRYRK